MIITTITIMIMIMMIIGAGTDFHICSLPHDSGSCDRKEFRYFYNSLERRCKLFVYGGCKGNQVEYLQMGQQI